MSWAWEQRNAHLGTEEEITANQTQASAREDIFVIQ